MTETISKRNPFNVQKDETRNERLPDFARATLKDRYLLPDEDYQDAFVRVANAYADNAAHAQRLYDYMSKQWFTPATPVLSNGGAERGLPISCFLNEAQDNLESIAGTWNENVWLAAKGGGIGTYWGNVRGIGERVGAVGTTSGVVPFIKVQESQSLAISQGSQRRGAAAVYLQVDHPEIEEFLDIRQPTNGSDPSRKAVHLHQGIIVSDKFMENVEKDLGWNLRSPKTGATIRKVRARDLWAKILTTRIETGEPYIIFGDTVNNAMPSHLKELGLKVKTSNLCSEIMLPTGLDQHGKERTAVCCLSSVNLEFFKEWKDNDKFIEDLMRFLDNVLQDFIVRAPDSMSRARYAAIRERSVGLGAMGFHYFLQRNGIPFESAMAAVWNKKMFEHIQHHCALADSSIAHERGSCPDALECDDHRRFSHWTAIAPNASSSIIGNSSPSIEPFPANAYTHKTMSGSFPVVNKYLKALLQEKGKDTPDVWQSIKLKDGSVQHLDFLDQAEKDTFKTAFEIDQRWVVEHAADRTPYICQAQSVNVFLPSDVDKRTLNQLHLQAWRSGVKSLYYCRSKSIKRADQVSYNYNTDGSTECLACEG